MHCAKSLRVSFHVGCSPTRFHLEFGGRATYMETNPNSTQIFKFNLNVRIINKYPQFVLKTHIIQLTYPKVMELIHMDEIMFCEIYTLQVPSAWKPTWKLTLTPPKFSNSA